MKNPSFLTFLIKTVSVRRNFRAKCIKNIHERKNFKQRGCFEQEGGRSMVEMLAVLAIIAVITAGSLVGYSKAMRRHRLNETITQVALMTTNIRSFYGNQDSYESFDIQTAVKYNMVSQRMLGANSTLMNPYKGRVTITLDKAVQGGPEKTAFVVTYRDLPVEACVGLATMDWGLGEKVGLIGVSVGADDGEPTFPRKPSAYFAENKQTRPLTMTEATMHCVGSDPQASRSVVAWKYF
ncbi:MAG TPA: hypothetical protein DIC64_02660 [Alphaproteobacteria bacterium]|nr:hypothetical protein [Alphaproteobacteria bacterium]